MAISRSKVALGALATALLAAGLPALGQQQQTPESILPPGFNEPAPAPAPTPAPTAAPVPVQGGDALAGIVGDAQNALDLGNSTEPADDTLDAKALANAEMPDFARRSLAITGIAGPGEGGLPANAFGRADGRYLEQLMMRLDAPIASRWLSIGLRRTLASRLATPAHVNGADYAAERAWLLVRMGEPVVARAVVQSVDNGNYTPKLYEAAMQAALATADPGMLCPIADAARTVSDAPGWVLAGAFCAGLSGDPGQGGDRIDDARRHNVARGIDFLLAEKVLGNGVQGRRAVTIEWDGVDQLTAWRYGLATATGATIPDALFATVNPRVALWRAQAPMLDATARAPVAAFAAAQGVLSSAALVDLYGELEGGDDQSTADVALARDLRTAYADADVNQRLTIMRQIWDAPKTPTDRYARLILTARAASLIPVGSSGADSDRLIASMLTAGLDLPAMRWMRSVSRGSDGWAMLQIVDPSGRVLGRSDVAAYSGGASGASGPKRAMFFAAMAGLGRVNPDSVAGLGRALSVDTALDNGWTRAIDRAAAEHQPGTVMLLAGVGMQTRDWRGVSPAALYRMIAAMHRTGLDKEARMIAVEALTRL